MQANFTGTLEVQLKFQEEMYIALEQGLPYLCATSKMFSSIADPDMFMSYIDKVTSMCRFRGNAGSMYVAYPKGYKFKGLTKEELAAEPKQ